MWKKQKKIMKKKIKWTRKMLCNNRNPFVHASSRLYLLCSMLSSSSFYCFAYSSFLFIHRKKKWKKKQRKWMNYKHKKLICCHEHSFSYLFGLICLESAKRTFCSVSISLSRSYSTKEKQKSQSKKSKQKLFFFLSIETEMCFLNERIGNKFHCR